MIPVWPLKEGTMSCRSGGGNWADGKHMMTVALGGFKEPDQA